MATPQQYLESILEKYNLTEGDVSNLKSRRAHIENVLRSVLGAKIEAVYYSGSYAKGTAVKPNFDLDVCLYFKHDSFENLREMHSTVLRVLKAEHTNVAPQTVSIHVDLGGTGIDVVPARSFSDGSGTANLYVATTGASLQTNIPMHKEYVSKSHARATIKLMKIWRNLHGIHFKSFALELLVIKALEKTPPDAALDVQFQKTLGFAANEATSVHLVDPANSNNIVSDLVPDSDKVNLQRQAAASYAETSWGRVVW